MSMPATAPFVVRNSTRRFVLQTILGLVLVLGGALLSFVFLTASLILLIPGVFIVVMSVLSLRNRAPLLTADEQGLFVQAFRGEGGVRRFAWHDIERLYVHRIGRQFRMLCVLPRDVERELQAAGPRRESVEKSLRICGAPYSVNLVAASVKEATTAQVLGELAQGRTHVAIDA